MARLFRLILAVMLFAALVACSSGGDKTPQKTIRLQDHKQEEPDETGQEAPDEKCIGRVAAAQSSGSARKGGGYAPRSRQGMKKGLPMK